VTVFTFDRELQVPGEPAAAWKNFTDVRQVVEWISVIGEAEELEPMARYTAVLADKIGMFSLRADLHITVTEVAEDRGLRVHAEGQDRQVGARIVIDGNVQLAPTSGGTSVRVSGSYEVSGRAATLGASSIRRKGDKTLDQFFENLSRQLSIS